MEGNGGNGETGRDVADIGKDIPIRRRRGLNNMSSRSNNREQRGEREEEKYLVFLYMIKIVSLKNRKLCNYFRICRSF